VIPRPKPANAQFTGWVGRKKTPVIAEQGFPHNQDPERTYAR